MNFFDKHKRGVIFIICLVCIVLAAWSANRFTPSLFEKTVGFVITPVQGAVDSAGRFFTEKRKYYKDTQALIDENEALKQEIEELKLNNSRTELLKQDNKSLSDILEIRSRYDAYTTTGARIIAKDPGNWYDTFIIDKGTNDGLAENMVVVSGGGLVGKISECGYNYSKVISIIDDSDAVSAAAMRTGDVGYVKGDYLNKGMCKMELIDMTSKMTEGDEIITSAFSSNYPEGIVIGTVKSIESSEKTSTKTALIEPSVDFRHLDTVLVITTIFKNPTYNFSETTEETTEATTEVE